jgi:hypothetical protein
MICIIPSTHSSLVEQDSSVTWSVHPELHNCTLKRDIHIYKVPSKHTKKFHPVLYKWSVSHVATIAMVCSWWTIYLERIIDVLLLFCDNFNETDGKNYFSV